MQTSRQRQRESSVLCVKESVRDFVVDTATTREEVDEKETRVEREKNHHVHVNRQKESVCVFL